MFTFVFIAASFAGIVFYVQLSAEIVNNINIVVYGEREKKFTPRQDSK